MVLLSHNNSARREILKESLILIFHKVVSIFGDYMYVQGEGSIVEKGIFTELYSD